MSLRAWASSRKVRRVDLHTITNMPVAPMAAAGLGLLFLSTLLKAAAWVVRIAGFVLLIAALYAGFVLVGVLPAP
jgi:hypothetical protein